MSLIISTVKKEKQRIDYMLEKYREMLEGLPKGTISEKKVNGNTYADRLKSGVMWRQ